MSEEIGSQVLGNTCCWGFCGAAVVPFARFLDLLVCATDPVR